MSRSLYIFIQLYMQRNLLGIISVDFDATGQLLITYSAFVKYLRQKWEYNTAVHQLFIYFKKACDSVMREALFIFSLSLVSL